MSEQFYLNIYRVLESSIAEGPGVRFCLWLQGCNRHCPGCCNAQMQSFEPRLLLPIANIWEMIENSVANNRIEGITLLGGEPLLQIKGLQPIVRKAHEKDLSVMLFTGYTYEECIADIIPGSAEFLRWVDVLVDGPFDQQCIDNTRNWVGSQNQRFFYLTQRYTNAIETDIRYKNIVEVRATDGEVSLNGCPHSLSPIQGKKIWQEK